MKNEAYVQMVADHFEEARKLADLGREIIETIFLQKGGENVEMTTEDLYGDANDPDWVWLEGSQRLTEIHKCEGNIVVVSEDECGDETERYLIDLTRDETIEIANFLCAMED